MIAMAQSAGRAPPVQESRTALEPLSMVPMDTMRFATPRTAKSMATEGPYRASKTLAVVRARKRRNTGAMSQ